MRVAVPTKDRRGTLPLCISNLAQSILPSDELYLYDDGDRSALADYSTRFALDLATQRGIEVVVKRGKPEGIAAARAKIMSDAKRDNVQYLLMVDDDILVSYHAYSKMFSVLYDYIDAAYSVPVIALANNEAGVRGFGKTNPEEVSHPQFQLGGKGTKFMRGGAWTCAIMFDLFRFDVDEAISRLVNGPKVVEDFNLTVPLNGYACLDSQVWHIMSHEQGERRWETLALEELRKQVGNV